MSQPASPATLLAHLARGKRSARLRHVERIPARSARVAPWPTWVAPPVVAAFTGIGVEHLWQHQHDAMELAHGGQHTVLATGTASGKSVGYLAPSLSAVVDGLDAASGRGATVLYLSPTKALAADQRARIEALAVPGVRAATYDGDTPSEERRWIREHANVVLTNPDLLHHSLLPGHRHWAAFLRSLRYVVIDECHTYRGVFGSHVALVLRRLWRLCARYRSTPTCVLASATVSHPESHASRLVGMPVAPVVDDASPREAMTFALWQPPEVEGSRRSATSEAAHLVADLVSADVQTLAFARSRSGAEAIASSARAHLAQAHPEREGEIAAYRGGYLPRERRKLEASMRDGSLRALAATNALELGVDISGLDAVVIAGWPGRRASLWQQAGRAGRAGRESLAIFVAADDPLDTFVLDHPGAIFDTPIESVVLDPANPHVVAPHLAAAAHELPLTEDDLTLFGSSALGVLDVLVERAVIRRRPTGWFWARSDRPSDHATLRGAESVVSIVERRSGRVLGTVDAASAHSQVHTGAVHVHQGETYVVTDFDLDSETATVVRGDPGWSTSAQSVSSFDIVSVQREEQWGEIAVCFGSVRVSTQVTGFVRRLPSGEIIGTHPLELPERSLVTRGVWWTMPVDLLEEAGVDEAQVPGAAHAAEHAAIGLMSLVAACDRWDVGGLSTDLHPDTGKPTIMVYDGYPGGAGFADRAHSAFGEWIEATRDAVRRCRCERGCPACVQSPKCGNGNEPLDKERAVTLLDVVVMSRPSLGPD